MKEQVLRYSITHKKVVGNAPQDVNICGTMVNSQAGARRRTVEIAKNVFGAGPWNGAGPKISIKEEHSGKVLEEFAL
jgi:hypothetical protein